VRLCLTNIFWQVRKMSNLSTRREGKEPTDDEANMPPDMKLMYRTFTSQFQKLNGRLDEFDE
jgi:hypothetical protein